MSNELPTLLLNNEEREFQDTVRSFFAERFPLSYVRQRFESGVSDPSFNTTLQELDLFSYFRPLKKEETPLFRMMALVCCEAGRALLPEPLSERLFAGCVLGLDPVQSSTCAVMYELPLSLKESFHKNSTDILLLSGELSPILGIQDAASLALLIRDTGKPLRKVICNLKDSKVAHRQLSSLDRTQPLSALICEEVPVSLSDQGASLPPYEVWYGILKAAELSGVASRVVEMTTEYVKTRNQFGAPIGSFQVIQHMLADAYTLAESVRALVYYAAWAVDVAPEEVETAGRAALLRATEVVPGIVETAVQLHGGIGFTWEHDLHLYLRRAKALQALFGREAALQDLLVEGCR